VGAVALKHVDLARLRQTYGILSIAAMAAMALAQFGFHGAALTLLIGACAWVGVVAVRTIIARPAVAVAI
jgi:branched-subunit amino acid transport protein AzlD